MGHHRNGTPHVHGGCGRGVYMLVFGLHNVLKSILNYLLPSKIMMFHGKIRISGLSLLIRDLSSHMQHLALGDQNLLPNLLLLSQYTFKKLILILIVSEYTHIA